MNRRVRQLLLFAGVFAITAFTAATAISATPHAHFRGSPAISGYTYSDRHCTIRSNPINVIFYGKTASASGVAEGLTGGTVGGSKFKEGTKGDRFPGGDNEYIKIAGRCVHQQRQLATHKDSSSLRRYHVRLFGLRKANGTYYRGTNGIIFTIGDAHLEDRFPNNGTYNSAVLPDGFDQGRTGVRHAWKTKGGTAPSNATFFRGNTATILQGNGNTPASNGYIVGLTGRMIRF